MKLEDLEVYQLSREISRDAWRIYERLDIQVRRVAGDQFIRAADSVGANIAEGWGRFHYADKNKFNYNARGSLLEVMHWLDILCERGSISESENKIIREKLETLHLKLNNYINTTRKQIIK